ncbi:MAG: GAF domain-containing protein, partial [Chloroflexi bacterium]|nr:GAF domain-containing protein [Chloroflexota bacterium]
TKNSTPQQRVEPEQVRIIYKALVEQNPVIVYTAGLGQHIGVAYISPQINSLGFNQEEWIADPEMWVRQIHPDDRKRVLDEIEYFAKNNLPFRSEYRILSRDGQVRWFLDEAVDSVDENGNRLFRQGFMLDLTSRKIAEEALSARERHLSLLNKITTSVIESQSMDELARELVVGLRDLLGADDCYLTRWDEKAERAFPLSATVSMERPYQSINLPSNLTTMTSSVMREARALIAEDVFNSPYISPELAKLFPARSMLGLPLLYGNTKLGAILVAYNTPHKFEQDEIDRAEQTGKQIAIAMWSAQQDFELKKRLRESETLARISRALSETERIGLADLLKLIAASAKELIPSSNQSVIHSLDAEKKMLTPEAVVGFENIQDGSAKMRLGEGIAGQSVTRRETLNITDVLKDPHFLHLGSPAKFRSLMVTPIISGDQILGTISVQSQHPNAFTKNDEQLLHTLGTHAAIAMDNAHLLESTRQALRETNALYRISRGLLALNADELLEDTADLLGKNFGYDLVQVYVIDPISGDFILKASSIETRSMIQERNHRLKAGSGIVGHVAETRKPFFTNDVNSMIFHVKNPIRPDIKSEMAVPIQVGERLFGILDLQQAESINFTTRDLQTISIVADHLAVSLQKADLYESLQTALQQEKTVRSQLVQNERLAIMGRLLASVSHELNNPLQAIQNALFLLKEEKGISQQGLNDLEIVLAESERMASMIERLRDTYRPPHAEDLQPTHINNIIEDVYALLATHLRKNKVTFEFHPDPDVPPIMALPNQIRQVALNLLMNGVEAMTNGGEVVVSTQHLRETHEVMLSVADTGAGVSPSILPYIFDPFVTNKKRGTGIGLTISHDIVIKHRGRIAAENNPNGGATFKVWLPIEAAPAEFA